MHPHRLVVQQSLPGGNGRRLDDLHPRIEDTYRKSFVNISMSTRPSPLYYITSADSAVRLYKKGSSSIST